MRRGGKPTAWKPLRTLSATRTAGLTRSGRITFDPPRRLGRRRRRRHAAAVLRPLPHDRPAAPPRWLKTILGRDYVGANGRHAGTIPAFDAAADREPRRLPERHRVRRTAPPGMNARFALREPAVLPGLRPDAVRHQPVDGGVPQLGGRLPRRFLAANPLADGAVHGQLARASCRSTRGGLRRADRRRTPTDYGVAARRASSRAIGPQWVLANTAGGGARRRTRWSAASRATSRSSPSGRWRTTGRQFEDAGRAGRRPRPADRPGRRTPSSTATRAAARRPTRGRSSPRWPTTTCWPTRTGRS